MDLHLSKGRMILLKKILAAVLSAAAALTMFSVSAGAENKTMVLDDAYIRIENNIGWDCLTRDDMPSEALSAGGFSVDSFKVFAEKNDYYLYCFNSNKSNIITVKCFSDSKSEEIFSLNDATYQQQQELIAEMASRGVIPENSTILSSNEKFKLNDQALVYVINYRYSSGKKNDYGCAYFTVQNGCYISIDLISKGKEIEKSTLAKFKNMINTVAFTRIDEKPLFTKEQLMIGAGGLLILLFLIFIISAGKRRKKGM